MGGGPSAPSVPDYTQTATQQANLQNQMIQQQTAANRPNQINPMGSQTWSQDPTTGQWTQSTQFSPQTQGLWDTYTGNIGQQGKMATGFLGGIQGANQQYGGTGTQGDILNQARNLDPTSVQNAYMARMQPQLTQQTNSLMAGLAAQGMTPGSDAYNQAVMLNNQKLNDAQSSAILNSGTWANQQQQNLNAQFQMADALRQQPLSNYQNLMAGTQVNQPQFGSFTNAAVGQAPNLTGAAQQTYQDQLANYNAAQASDTGIGSMLGTVVGGVGGFMLGGPMGAMAGSQLGGAAGGAAGKLF